MGSFGGGPLEKYPSRQLAGGLPYLMYGSKRGGWGNVPRGNAPRPYPTRDALNISMVAIEELDS